jgi:transposase IS66-like protein
VPWAAIALPEIRFDSQSLLKAGFPKAVQVDILVIRGALQDSTYSVKIVNPSLSQSGVIFWTGVHRQTTLSSKNWLFFGDADAGERSAIIYSIIENCQRHDIEPYTYLRDVLTRLPTMTNRQIKDIVPKAWAPAIRSTASRTA